MGRIILGLLIVPSFLFSWESAFANENKEFIAEPGDQGRGRKSVQGRDDSKKSPEAQTRGSNRDSQKQQRQTQQPQTQQPQIQQRQTQQPQIQQRQTQQPQTQQRQTQQHGNQEFKEIKSDDRKSEQRRDSNDRKRSWEDNRDAVKTLPKGDRDRSDYRRERISKERLKEKEIRWQAKSREWRKNFSNYKTNNHIFDDHFWNDFRRGHKHWYFNNDFQWYSSPNWSRIVVWLPWQWSQPIYYFYETDGDVYYSTTEDFSYLIPVDSIEIFIAQAVRIANGQYPISTQQSDWMPLGMFAFAPENDVSEIPKRFLSLAISKTGAVTGAYFDAASNTTVEIQGGIDPVSQRIAWKFVGNDWPIMESGLYNLTKEESTLLIHTSSRITETQLLIRLDK